MYSFLNMAAQVEPVELNQAIMLYSLGFSIQIAIDNERFSHVTIVPENHIEQYTFDEYMYNSHIWDKDHSFYHKVKFLADIDTLSHAGIHVVFDDKTPNLVQRGTFEEIRDKLMELQKQYKLENMYVKHNMIFADAVTKPVYAAQ